MDCAELRTCLLAFFADSYPNMEIIVEPWREAPGRLAIYFIEEKFGLIYPRQRYHYVTHLIPTEFQEKWLQNSVWFELAPGEAPEQLDYHDDAVLAEITEPIMDILQKTSFFKTLDEALSRELNPELCWGDFRVSKSILPRKGFAESEFFDVLNVLMSKGGYCDCEVLLNVAPESAYAKAYWISRAGTAAHNQKDNA
jgi:hypothetical protein